MYSLIPNILSLMRLPLAMFFLSSNVTIRIIATILAAFSDMLDGFLARRFNKVSFIGTILDPVMDKFFTYFVLGVFLLQNDIEPFVALSMLSRDFAILLLVSYVLLFGDWRSYTLKSFYCGKFSTALQMLSIGSILCGYNIHPLICLLFVVFGILSILEISFTHRQKKAD